MPPRNASPHDHGPSEIWDRPAVKRHIRAEQKALGARVRKARRDLKLSIEAAAERIGVHPRHLQRIEHGRANVTYGTIVAIALGLHVSLDRLVTDR